MNELRCSMRKCSHNKGFCCHASTIEVDGGADCATYDPADKKQHNSNVMYEAGMDAFSQKIINTKVFCEAEECLFNRERICKANGISVTEEDAKAICATFIEK